MGEVYLCRDPDLDRQVAIKRVLDYHDEVMRERLRREARALARLNHRNVVQVYEGGEHEGRFHIVMEYVEGQTMSEWLGARERSWQAIVSGFCAAGRGLAAAHDAGLIHRDFKPDNVLVGADGVVRVADFGLAAGEGWGPSLRAGTGEGSNDERLSSAGALIGTCHYMPLEQLLGEEVDARSDQFAFCMSLFEALWCELAYPYVSLSGRVEALRQGKPSRPGGLSAIYRVLCRGLERDPDARWPSMEALLAALERIPRRRRRLAVGMASVGLGVGLGLAALEVFALGTSCADPSAQLEGVWSSREQAEFDAHLVDLGDRAASTAGERISDKLDRWAKAWAQERGQVCTALKEAAGDPGREREAGLRDACLTRELRRVEFLVAGLSSSTDAGTLTTLAATELWLPSPKACGEQLALLGAESPHESIAAQVESLRFEIEDAAALRTLGRAIEGRARMLEILAGARALGDEPLLAEAYAELGKLEEVLGATERSALAYDQGIHFATQARHDSLAAELMRERAEQALFEHDLEVARMRYEQAKSFSGREELSAKGKASLYFIEGALAQFEGDSEAALEAYKQAVAVAPTDLPAYPAYLSALAGLLGGSEGVALRIEAYESSVRVFGPEHPRTADYLYACGVVQKEEAGEGLRGRAVELWAQRDEPRYRARVELELAEQSLQHRQLGQAWAHAHALARWRASYLPLRHPDRGDAEHIAAKVAALAGDHDLAIERLRAAKQDYASSPRDDRLLRVDLELADQLMARGEGPDFDEARRLLLARIEAERDAPEQTALTHLAFAELGVREGQYEVAAQQLHAAQRGMATLSSHRATVELLAGLIEARRASEESNRSQALAALARVGERHEHALTGYRSWLDSLGLRSAEREALGLKAEVIDG